MIGEENRILAQELKGQPRLKDQSIYKRYFNSYIISSINRHDFQCDFLSTSSFKELNIESVFFLFAMMVNELELNILNIER